ncbi:MAG: TPM domain-containing protein [Oscillospiraceae bacterium]|nr:TPM domain-containing protein [Oscillospiraceae bacterium]
MKKKPFLHLLSAAAAAVCGMICLVLPVSATREHEETIQYCTLYDPDDMFAESEEASLNEMIRSTSDEIDMYVAVNILGDSGSNYEDYEVEDFTDNRYDELFNMRYEKEQDGIMLTLNMPSHYIYISSCGIGELYYYNGGADDRIYQMNENMKDALRRGDNAGAIAQFCSDCIKYYKQGLPDNAYTYNDGNGMYAYNMNGEIVFSEKLPWWFGVNWKFLGILAVIFGGLAGLISMLVIKSSYQLKKSLDPSNYVSEKETKFLVKDDIFIRAHTTKTHIDRSSGGGGGGGGSSHTSSGGFSHGGGGSHW